MADRLGRPPAAAGPQLVMLPPASRGTPHFHAACETAIYLVSGETEVWHGAGLVRRCTVRPGDFVYIPPGTPHLAVNHGEVTSIAVVARTDPADAEGAVMIELPRHLAGLRDLPVASSSTAAIQGPLSPPAAGLAADGPRSSPV